MSPDHHPNNIHTPYEKKALPHPDTCTNWLHQWLRIFLDKDLMQPELKEQCVYSKCSLYIRAEELGCLPQSG
jgi:hypothetical protein